MLCMIEEGRLTRISVSAAWVPRMTTPRFWSWPGGKVNYGRQLGANGASAVPE
jgi:hypothetical protein